MMTDTSILAALGSHRLRRILMGHSASTQAKMVSCANFQRRCVTLSNSIATGTCLWWHSRFSDCMNSPQSTLVKQGSTRRQAVGGVRSLAPRIGVLVGMVSRSQVARVLPIIATFLFAATRLFRMVDGFSVNILIGDQWAFNDATIFQQHSWLEIFRWQYGPHRLGVGAVLAKLIEPSLRWNSRYEAFGVWGVLCLACLAALGIKRRLLGGFTLADCVIPLLFLTPVQYEVFFGNSPSHGPLPLLLLMLYCLAWTIEGRNQRYAAVLVLNLALIYTGFGLFVGFITPALLALEIYRDRRASSIIGFIVACGSLASFFIGYHYDTAVRCAVRFENPAHYFLFVSFMLARFMQIYVSRTLVPAILAGGILAIAFLLTTLVCCFRLLRERSQCTLIVATLLSYCAIFAFVTAYGRTCLGLAAAQGSRYATYMIPGFFGLYLAALTIKVKLERRIFVSLAIALALLSSLRTDSVTRSFLEQNSPRWQQWKQCYFVSHDISSCDAATRIHIWIDPEPTGLLKSRLDYLEQHRLNLYAP